MGLFMLKYKPEDSDFYVKNEVSTEDMVLFYEYIKSWCILNKFIINNGSQYIPNIADEGFFKSFFSYNLKSLRNKESFDKFMAMMTDNKDSRIISRLYDLFIILSTRMNGTFLNLYMERYFYALNQIEKDPTDEYTWEDIREAFPLIWLIDYIQTLMRLIAVPE